MLKKHYRSKPSIMWGQTPNDLNQKTPNDDRLTPIGDLLLDFFEEIGY